MERKSGILLHIAALPSVYGIGTLGRSAYAFTDFLAEAGQTYWQVLPLVPTGYGDSPYQSSCSYAGSEYFIDPEILMEKGLLTKEDLAREETAENSRVDYSKLFERRIKLLRKAYSSFVTDEEFGDFIASGKYSDYALFRALKEKFDFKEFSSWPDGYKKRDPETLGSYAEENTDDITFYLWVQYEFLSEWKKLKSYANSKGIKIIGDIPIYVSRDSAECWTDPGLFSLDEDLRPVMVAGCPPDYFSAEGQLWGNPVYNYSEMEKDGFLWWRNRMRMTAELFDAVRIDHFRGFDRFYEIPAGEKTAVNGHWTDGPSDRLVSAIISEVPDTEIIAEDLGLLDDSVRGMIARSGLPGMKILSFAFDSDGYNPYLPSVYDSENTVAYTGTHDNDTLLSLVLSRENDPSFKERVRAEAEKCGINSRPGTAEETARCIIDLALFSKAKTVILPFQDWALTGGEGRTNLPSTLSTDNWSYRISGKELSRNFAAYIKEKTLQAGRIPS